MSESTMESEHVDASGATPTEEYPQYLRCGMGEEDVKTLEACPFNAALAWRTLASFTRILRDANLGGVLLPLVESLGMVQMLVSRWEGTLWRHAQCGNFEISGQTNSRWIRWDISLPVSQNDAGYPWGGMWTFTGPWSSANGPPWCFVITLWIHVVMECLEGMEYDGIWWNDHDLKVDIKAKFQFEHPSRLTILLLM